MGMSKIAVLSIYQEVYDLGDLPDSIPMVKKKSRGRPRKYPRLDDVLRYKNSLESDITEEDVKMEERETYDGDAGDFYEIVLGNNFVLVLFPLK